MRRWTAVALVLPLLGLGALFANAGGRRWVRERAAEQVDDVLDAIAVTAAQRAALDEAKEALAVRLESKMAQLGTMIRTAWHFGASDCPLRRHYQVMVLPGHEPVWIERSVDIEFHSAPPTPLRSCHSGAQLAVPRFLPSLILVPDLDMGGCKIASRPGALQAWKASPRSSQSGSSLGTLSPWSSSSFSRNA